MARITIDSPGSGDHPPTFIANGTYACQTFVPTTTGEVTIRIECWLSKRGATPVYAEVYRGATTWVAEFNAPPRTTGWTLNARVTCRTVDDSSGRIYKDTSDATPVERINITS